MTPRETPVGTTAERIDRRAALELLVDEAEGTVTAVPATATGDDRLTRWLTVDETVLCDLEAWR